MDRPITIQTHIDPVPEFIVKQVLPQRWWAFAVAAHLEPEILIVDEVMDIGDTGFQRKWLNLLKNN